MRNNYLFRLGTIINNYSITVKAELVAKRDDCTKALAKLRKDRKTAARIIDDNPKIKENILIEENMRNRYYGINKQRKRGYER